MTTANPQPLNSQAKRDITQKKHADLQKRYDELCRKKVEGMRLRIGDIYAKLASEFYYSEKTVEKLLSN